MAEILIVSRAISLFLHKCSIAQPSFQDLSPVLRSLQGRAAAREDRRDRTAFETARKEWSKTAGISNRRAVGSGGDHHSEVWLG